eukprot:CAMPEP_0174337852 /NCGR_PEP_ID=MMETSP0810-20121108/22652_1 /TAXON_ID=73025 ORGANISM="Eutreptiella gymnastica-like, Strain CCMP1594" /NCGR_SAMPLE_ID=MMETSP0810 /ASSEMBLY_ACC=CAM_ASM_000659 /LENGTH=44 /DNA_ID= /DNA_START= /DNA_END= /DNA_ORIENTATION=
MSTSPKPKGQRALWGQGPSLLPAFHCGGPSNCMNRAGGRVFKPV